MAGIDLPPIVGPGAPGVAGGYLSQFGNELMQLGAALGKQRQYAPEQQALLDAESTKQLIAAKSLAYDKVNAFNKELDTNTDYQHYGDTWTSYKAGINDAVSSIITLPGARQKYDEWWLTEADKQNDYVAKQARGRTVAAAQAQGQVAIENFANGGNEGAIKSTIREMVSGGLWNSSEATNVAREYIPKARYNFILQQLDKLDDPNAAIETLTNPEASQRFQLDPKQVEDLTRHFEDQKASKQTLANEQRKEQQQKMTEDLITNASDPKTMPTREALSKAMAALLGSPGYEIAKSLRDAVDEETKRINEAKIQRDMTANYSQFDTSMRLWDGNGQAPWGPKELNAALNAKDTLRITEPEYNQLNDLYTSTMKGIADGTRKGPNFLDPRQEQAAWQIALDTTHGWNAETKKLKIQAMLGNGLPGAKVNEIAGAAVNLETTDKARKDYLDPIETYTKGRIDSIVVNQGKEAGTAIQSASYEGFQLKMQMMDFMRRNPGNEKAWGDQLDKIMSGKASQDAVQAMLDQYKVRFPAFGSYFFGQGPRFTAEMQLEAARTQGLVTDVASQARWRSNLPKIQQQETDFLAQNGIKNIVNSKLAPNNEMNYLAKDNSIYKVVQEPVNGVMRNVIYKVVNGQWVKVK